MKANKKADKNFYEEKYWTYNTIQEWQKEFPFWSVDTVKRTLTKLRKLDILTTGNFNKMKRDRTLWYTINYDEFEKLDQESKKIEKDNNENILVNNLEQEEDSTMKEMEVKKDKEIKKEERQLQLPLPQEIPKLNFQFCS